MVATKSLLCFIVGSMAWVNTYAQPRGEQSLCRAFVEENCECSTATSREERSSCVLECITGNVDEENVCAKMVERMEAREKCHAFIEQECSNCTSGDHRAEHTCVRTCLEENDSEGLCEMRGMGKGRKNRNMTMDDLEMVDVEQHGPNGPMGDHKPSEKCRAFVEENCECEIAIDIEGTKEGDAKEHAEKDVQKHTGGSDEGHRQPVPHGADGGPRKGGEVSECVHECIESLDTDGVCKREGKNGNMTVVDEEMYDGEHGPNGPMGEHKPSEECRAFVEENCECEIAIDIEKTKKDDAKEHPEKDEQKHTGGSARGHGKPVPHGGHGGQKNDSEVSECVHECIESLDTDGVCKREGNGSKNGNSTMDDLEMVGVKEHGRNGPMGEHKPSEECRAFVEENCECEIAIDTEGAKEGDAKEHPEKDVQKHTGGSARGHGKPVPHGGHGGPKNDSEVSECVHECIESLDTDGVCKREGKGRKNGNMTVVDQEMYDGEHGLNGSRGEHKPTEECRTFVEESCECEIAIDIKETKEGDAKEHSEKDVQKNTGGSARGHGKPVPHGGHGGPRKGGEFSECVHECIRSLDTDGVCKREEREQAEAVDSE